MQAGLRSYASSAAAWTSCQNVVALARQSSPFVPQKGNGCGSWAFKVLAPHTAMVMFGLTPLR